MDNLVRNIGELASGVQRLTRAAERQYAVDVEATLKTQNRDSMRIERCLDGILDFCFDDGMLLLYRKLCRYYFAIDPGATASYLWIYKEMGRKKSRIKKTRKRRSLVQDWGTEV